MNLGGVGGIGAGLPPLKMRVSDSRPSTDSAELRKQLTSQGAPRDPQEDKDTASNNTVIVVQAQGASSSSSTSSSEAPDYSSMTVVDLMKLALKGDTEAKAELEKRGSEKKPATTSARLDIVA